MDYTHEKLHMAVYGLATNPERIRDRLVETYRDTLHRLEGHRRFDKPNPPLPPELDSRVGVLLRNLEGLAAGNAADDDACMRLATEIVELDSLVAGEWRDRSRR